MASGRAVSDIWQNNAMPERFFLLAALCAYPVLPLIAKGWVSGCFFFALIVSIVLLVRTVSHGDRLIFDRSTVFFSAAMASLVLAILISQACRREFSWTPYDEASRLLLAVPIYLALRKCRLNVVNIMGVSFAAGVVVTLVTLLVMGPARGAGDQRLGSHFLNVVHFGDLALMLGFLSLFSLRAGRERSPMIVALKVAGFFAGLYLSLRSGTRGGWIAMPVLLVIWILCNSRLTPKTIALTTGGLLALAGVAGYLIFDLVDHRIAAFYTDLAAMSQGNADTSVGFRVQILKASTHVFLENPLFGVGTQGYKQAMSALAASGVVTPAAAEMGIAEVHNQILSYAVKYGIFGLISGLAIHLVPLFIFIRSLKSETVESRIASAMGICLVTGFFIFGLTVEIFNLKNTITFYAFTLAVLLAAATTSTLDADSTNSVEKP